jgi:hypothetical protein
MEEAMNAKQSSLWRGLVIPWSVFAAVLTFIFSTIDSRRNDELTHVRNQIATLYGPMYTLGEAQKRIRERVNDTNVYDNLPIPISEDMEKIFLSSKQYINCEHTRKQLEDLVNYVEYYKTVQLSGAKIDTVASDKTFSEHDNKALNYPENLDKYIGEELINLRDREAELANPFTGVIYTAIGYPKCPGESP